MNVSELYFLAEWIKNYGKNTSDLYEILQRVLEHNANQPQKQPLEEPLNNLVEHLNVMNLNQLSNGQLEYLEQFEIGPLLGRRGAQFVNATVRKSDFDPATANSEIRVALEKLEQAIQKANQILDVFSNMVFKEEVELHEQRRITVRIEFQGQAQIENVTDWKVWSATWHDIVRGVGLAVNERPEDTKVIGASQGSVIMILATTYGFTKVLALISKSIASIAKDYLEVRMVAEKLKAIKNFNAATEKQLLENAEEIQQKGVESIIEDIKASLDHDVTGDAEAALRHSISKALDFYEKGGEVDFVSPSAEQAEADSEGDDAIPAGIIEEVRQVIESARRAKEEVKLLTSQVTPQD